MAHEFVILRKGKLESYSNYEEIPLDFNHIIKFLPEIPHPPHTDEQHEEIDQWQEKFNRLLEIEKQNGSSSSASSSVN